MHICNINSIDNNCNKIDDKFINLKYIYYIIKYSKQYTVIN